MTKLFDEQSGIVAPSPSTYVRNALLTLGYTDSTGGWWCHSFMIIVFKWLPLPESAHISFMRTIGEKTYKNAIAKKKK